MNPPVFRGFVFPVFLSVFPLYRHFLFPGDGSSVAWVLGVLNVYMTFQRVSFFSAGGFFASPASVMSCVGASCDFDIK